MRDWRWPEGGTLRERSRTHIGLEDRIDEVLGAVATAGFAHLRGVVPEPVRRRLLVEAGSVGGRFLSLPDRVNGVDQRAEQLSIRLGDINFPQVNELATDLVADIASGRDSFGLARFAPTEARFMRYQGRRAGLGAHRDGTCYWLLVAIYSLEGRAPFTVLPDEDSDRHETERILVQPGDLVLLRAPGFGGQPDGRPHHSVGAPLQGERVSLTIRMVGRHGAPPG